MKSPFVSELKPNEIATAVFLVHSKEIRQKRTGEPYLSLLLADRTGELDAKMWDNVAEVMDTFDRDDFVKVKGLMQIYNNRPQFTIHKMRRMEDQRGGFRRLFPGFAARSRGDVARVARPSLPAIANPHIRALLDAFLDDPEIAARYRSRARRQDTSITLSAADCWSTCFRCAGWRSWRPAHYATHRSRPADRRRACCTISARSTS